MQLSSFSVTIYSDPPVSILCWHVGACFNQSRCNCLTHWAIRTHIAWEGWWLIFICIEVSISGAHGYCGSELAAWAITSYRKYPLASCLRNRYCCIPCWFGDELHIYRNDRFCHNLKILLDANPSLSTISKHIWSPAAGQSWELQFLLSTNVPVHSNPPFCAGWSKLLMRCWDPSPQVLEHVPQDPQLAQVQFTKENRIR